MNLDVPVTIRILRHNSALSVIREVRVMRLSAPSRFLLSGASAVALLLLPIHLPQAMEYGARVTVNEVRAVQRRLPEPLQTLQGKIQRNSTLASLLSQTLSPGNIHQLVEASRPAYDLAKISVGHPFGLAVRPDGLIAAFTYGIDEIRTLHVKRDGDALTAQVVTREPRTEVRTVTGPITPSLFGAVSDAGEQDQLALDLAEIFAWDVDFNTELQKGDSFRVAVEKMSVDGRFYRYGRILSAELKRGDRVLQAVRFESTPSTG